MSFIEITPIIQGRLDRIRKKLAVLESLRAAKGRLPLGYSQLLAENRRQVEPAHQRLSHFERLDELMEFADRFLDEVQAELTSADEMLLEQEVDRLQIGRSLRAQVRDLAEVRSRQVVTFFQAAASAFIDDELRFPNWKILTELVHGMPPEMMRERMKDRLRDAFLHLDASPNWLDALYKEFLEDVRSVVQDSWTRFLRNLQNSVKFHEKAVALEADFLDRALIQISGALLQRGTLGVLIGVFTYLLFVPGGLVLEVVAVLGLAILNIYQDPFEKPRENAKLRANIAIEANRMEIRNLFVSAGMELHNVLDQRFEEELKRLGQGRLAERQALQKVRMSVATLRAEWTALDAETKAFAKGGNG